MNSQPHTPVVSSSSSSTPIALSAAQVDGPVDIASPEMQSRRRRLAGDVCAIFVHAGAGYHSVQNERVHLTACEDAAKSAMTFLNNGGSAVDAVEIAVKILEDKEITNAGFGSNLAMDGTVECDATIVDHYGRSGAVGAVGCLRNPIHLARLVLEHTTQPLSLRRVPPNLLVGQGATDFASEIGVPIVHPDILVSPAAGERYARWKADLNKASTAEDSDAEGDERTIQASIKVGNESIKKNGQNLELVPCWNESQPYSPLLNPSDTSSTVEKPDAESRSKGHFWLSTEPGHDGQHSIKSYHADDEESLMDVDIPWLDDHTKAAYTRLFKPRAHSQAINSSEETEHPLPKMPNAPPPTRSETPSLFGAFKSGDHSGSLQDVGNVFSRPDDITDTVGAIAIDCLGNIAAGSSSGGIGMKHKGRVGPAALVGIGTAVVPIESRDEAKLCVATVTSGTGEHMATTMAAGSCASRLYSTTYRGMDGSSEAADDDDQAIRSFVERDFMGHPSVKHSHSAGAIGILGVKKTTGGVHLYFAHNTDSFAVGSMAGDDKEPRSVMSRNKIHNNVVTGGRSVRYRRWPTAHKGTWPTNPDDALDPEIESPHASKRQKMKRVPKGKAAKQPKTKSAHTTTTAPAGSSVGATSSHTESISAA